MDIGKAINQKSFKDPFGKVVINILYTSTHIDYKISELFKTKGLQKQHFNILRIIKGNHPKPVSPGYIKSVMIDKGRDLTRLLDKLEKLNYINRESNPNNRRSLNVFISEKGLEATDELTNITDQWYNDNRVLSDEESEQLSNLLDKLRSGFCKV